MAFADIFKRKKKDEFLDLGAVEPGSYGPGAEFPSTGAAGPYGVPPPQLPDFPLPGPEQQMDFRTTGPPPPPQGHPELENVRQQLETLNYKLDTLKAVLDTLNSRIANIENALKVTPFERQGGGF